MNFPTVLFRFQRLFSPTLIVAFAFISTLAQGRSGFAQAEPGGQSKRSVQFAQEVRPILSNHCWNCHGPDETSRQANLRLDLQDAAKRGGDSGLPGIVPGNVSASEVIARIDSHDPDLMMPPASTRKPLSEEQKQILKEWVRTGGEYSEHWAFLPPSRPALPEVHQAAWPVNEIDRFVLHRLEQEQLLPSVEASPAIWLRRVTLDLTGLPPSLEELDQFEQDLQSRPRTAVYESVVDRLLSSHRYAERMTLLWLDAARYADTNGYNNDEIRTMWPWRDWVINAYRSDMPYDQFLTEQLAGDLLPDATVSQKVATGFCRNHVLTTEGGIIEEEYHVEYVADRVHTTSTVFMALSMQCARCHDHKYDPISQRDYYELAAFFNNVPDKVVSYNNARMAEPLLKVPSPEQSAELLRITARMTEIEQLLQSRKTAAAEATKAWEASLTAESITQLGAVGLAAHFDFDEDGDQVSNLVPQGLPGQIEGPGKRVAGKFGQALVLDQSNYVRGDSTGDFENTDRFSMAAWILLESTEAGTVMSKMDENNAHRGYDMIMENAHVAAHFVHHWPDQAFKVVTKTPISLKEWHHLVVTYDGSQRSAGVKIFVDGVEQEISATTDNELTGTLRTEKSFHIGRRQASARFRGLIDDVRLFNQNLSADDVAALSRGEAAGQIGDVLKVAPESRSAVQQEQLVQYYLQNVDATSHELKAEFSELPARREAIEKEIPATMVMEEPDAPRPAFILKRGEYDQRGDEVTTNIPAVFRSSIDSSGSDTAPGWNETSAPRTRLDLARWLTTPQHPLTARVAVNRLWEILFGTGLVETSEDFGIQGSYPSHPELLDWLATELVQQQWSQRVLLKKIVLSATYRQSSSVTPELLERDPRNRLLTRGARFRLPAETVRDTALFVSGLLRERVGGPSVKPYQPEGLWEDVSVERRDKYVPDEGEGLYRRSLYTFWKRTCPPPGMSTFDAPDRETCLVRRARTNTPLQALVLLNDPTYVESARKLAEQCLLLEDEDSRLRYGFRRALGRSPDESERLEIATLIQAAEQRFEADESAANELLGIGHSTADTSLKPSKLAAWTTAMSVLLNLDETISRQ